ncbi:Na+/H+ antiporter subunit E [Myxococcota bacterium]|nr:Na+/H+ antiporter subunit E [Myxococcota bacterium]
MALVGNFHPQEIIAGGVVALGVSVLAKGEPFASGLLRVGNPLKRLAYIVGYLFFMAWAIIKSNLDVARRVISPSLPIKPGIVRVKTKLKSPTGRYMLANSITLTPGTLTVDMCEENFYIHWIDVESEDLEVATQKIVSDFEKYLEVIFD